MTDGVSIIMPAYNEAGNLRKAVTSAAAVCKNLGVGYEVIIVNDGSTDGTGLIARSLAESNPRIRVIESAVNRGLGAGLKLGIAEARMRFVTLYPSDNEMSARSFRDLILARARAELVMAYMANPEARSPLRRLVSSVFVAGLNMCFGLSVRYYTGPFIARTRLLRDARLVSDGVTILAELRVKLARRNVKRIEIPFTFRMRRHGRASLFRFKTITQAAATLVELFGRS
jgi:glycosyltransferase involved in cell wall biosynthesis